jgi:hypothetical protein
MNGEKEPEMTWQMFHRTAVRNQPNQITATAKGFQLRLGY